MPPRLIYETVHGSRAYGLDRAGSDEDRRGVIVGPPSWYFGFVGGPEQIAHSDDLAARGDHVRGAERRREPDEGGLDALCVAVVERSPARGER